MRQTYKYDSKKLSDIRVPETQGSEPARPKDRSLLFISVATLLSLATHLALLIVLPKFFENPSPQAPLKGAQIVFREKREQKIDPKQVVELPPSLEQVKPKEAKYLANEDHTAKKESKRRFANPSPENLSANPTKKASSEEAETAQKPKVELAMEAPTADDFLAKPRKQASSKDPLGLKPQLSHKGAAQAPPASENLENVESGDDTDLNTWQWRHAPFFNRVKAAVGRVWAPNVQISRYDPRGQLLGQKDRTTIMSVTIDHEGNLKDLKLAASSGVAYLDEEAERTFRAAAPFPFPPKELFASAQEFTFNFAFHIEINRGLSFDFEWGKD